MSRLGKIPITIPAGVQATLGADNTLTVKGPKGQLAVNYREHVTVRQEDGAIHVERHNDSIQNRAFHGLYQRLFSNLVLGVTEGFKKNLVLNGVGYRAAVNGRVLVMSLGYSHEVRYAIPDGIEIKTPVPTQIEIVGIDKQKVGQVAAEIRSHRPPEPYKGKGIRYSDEVIRRKEGKAGAKK